VHVVVGTVVGHARKNLVQGNALNTVYAMKENVPVKLITLAMIVPREDAPTTVQEKARAVVHQTTNVFAKTVLLVKTARKKLVASTIALAMVNAQW
jgi:hypothetical protein